jgi:arylsulfatase A-like enzyme
MRCVVFIFLLLPALVARADETFKKDMLPTMCELTGQPVPKQSDGISFLPTLRGASKKQAKHDYLYFEFCTGASKIRSQALRTVNWKAYRPVGKPLELFNLATDPYEKTTSPNPNPTAPP